MYGGWKQHGERKILGNTWEKLVSLEKYHDVIRKQGFFFFVFFKGVKIIGKAIIV